MGMIERGEAMGFRIDPTTGEVTVTRARTAAEISAAAAPGLAQLGVEERDGKYYEIGSNTEITAESDRAGWDAI
jgi:cellulase/cellobiase CelA1